MYSLAHSLPHSLSSSGMPYPHNFNTALAVQDIIKANNCLPATIAVLNGEITVGLTDDQLHSLAKHTASSAVKTSRRDLAHVVSQKLTGGTTVAATMIIARMAGIKIFVTGGIGGCHRGVQDSWDVSADLTELGKTPVAVVCAGVKSILDIPRTLEYLETQGVSVTTISKDPNAPFPAFYTPTSDSLSPLVLPSPLSAATMIHANSLLNLNSGMVFAVPIPSSQAAYNMTALIDQAVEEAAKSNIIGRLVTPFILDRVAKASKGEALAANIALIKNNALIGSQIATEYHRLILAGSVNDDHAASSFPFQQKRFYSSVGLGGGGCRRMMTSFPFSKKNNYRSYSSRRPTFRPLIVGLATIDTTATVKSTYMPHTSNPSSLKKTHGGVGRNITEASARTGGFPVFVSCVGSDVEGQSVVAELERVGVDTGLVRVVQDGVTAQYIAVLDRGHLVGAVVDTTILNAVTFQSVDLETLNVGILCLDGNLPLNVLVAWVQCAEEKKIPVLFEPTSVEKSCKIVDLMMGARSEGTVKNFQSLRSVQYVSPDSFEVKAMARRFLAQMGLTMEQVVETSSQFKGWEGVDNDAVISGLVCLRFCETVILKIGGRGVVLLSRGKQDWSASAAKTVVLSSKCIGLDGSEDLTMVHLFPPVVIPDDQVVSVTGAGDTLVGTVLSGLQRGLAIDKAVIAGMWAASESVKCLNAVGDGVGAWVFDGKV